MRCVFTMEEFLCSFIRILPHICKMKIKFIRFVSYVVKIIPIVVVFSVRYNIFNNFPSLRGVTFRFL